MFGLEQNKKKGRQPFKFDLEKDIEQHPKKKQEILSKIDARVLSLKQALREGQAVENFEQCGFLLKGYAALNKVLARMGS